MGHRDDRERISVAGEKGEGQLQVTQINFEVKIFVFILKQLGSHKLCKRVFFFTVLDGGERGGGVIAV